MKIKKGFMTTNEFVEMFGSDKIKKTYLEEKNLSGSSRTYLIKKARRYCDIEIKDGLYIIKEVYKYPIPSSFNKLNEGLYQYLAPIILNKLINVHDENNKIVLPLMDYARNINMINENYQPVKYNQRDISSIVNIDMVIINEYFEKVDDDIRYYIQRCLEYLQSADVLKWYKVPMVRKKKSSVVIENGNPVINCDYEDVRATSEEVKYYNNLFEETRLELNIKSKSECFFGSKAIEFCKKLSEKLKETSNILYFYDSYEIYYTSKERCYNLLTKFKNYSNEKLIIKQFNTEFIKHIVSNAEKRQIKEIEKMIKTYRVQGNYITDFKTLSELTINKDSEKIYFKKNRERINKIDEEFTFKVVKKYKNTIIEKEI